MLTEHKGYKYPIQQECAYRAVVVNEASDECRLDVLSTQYGVQEIARNLGQKLIMRVKDDMVVSLEGTSKEILLAKVQLDLKIEAMNQSLFG